MNIFTENFDLVNDVAPGRHFYQFYKTSDDLLKVLLPYWKSGVQKKNFCFWVVPAFMTTEQAKASLSRVISNINDLIYNGAFEIVPHAEWYGDGETFDGDLVLSKYLNRIKEAISNGFSVVRLSGDLAGFQPHLWSAVQEYEANCQSQIHMMPCIALCSYPLHTLRLQQTKDVLDHHHSALVAKV